MCVYQDQWKKLFLCFWETLKQLWQRIAHGCTSMCEFSYCETVVSSLLTSYQFVCHCVKHKKWVLSRLWFLKKTRGAHKFCCKNCLKNLQCVAKERFNCAQEPHKPVAIISRILTSSACMQYQFSHPSKVRAIKGKKNKRIFRFLPNRDFICDFQKLKF